jgi:hypothetical protein
VRSFCTLAIQHRYTGSGPGAARDDPPASICDWEGRAMPEMPIMLRIQASRDDADELEQLADELRPLAQHVVAPGDGPPQKFDVDVVNLIAVAGSAGVFSSIVAIVTVYLQRNKSSKAVIDLKNQKIDLTGFNGAEVERIVHEIQSKH